MPVSESRSNPFFLTQSAANIQEDLSRSLQNKSSVSLLYGVPGVGKSRLIDHFIKTRLAQADLLLIRFLEQGLYICEQISSQPKFQVTLLQQLTAKLPIDGILIFDQLEKASPDITEQLFRLWQKQLLNNDLKIIMICDTTGLKNVFNLSQQFHIEISSVEIKTLSDKDRIAYLESLVCDGLRQKLSINRAMKKALKNTQGLFPRLDLMLQLQSRDMSCSSHPSLQKFEIINRWLAVSLGLSVSVLLGVYFFEKNKIIPVMAVIYPQKIESRMSEIKTDAELPILQKSLIIRDPVVTEQLVSNEIVNKKTAQLVEKNINTLNQDANKVFAKRNQSKVSRLDEILLEKQLEKPSLNPVEFGMQTMKSWLQNALEQQASIQIMTVRYSDQSISSLNRYINRLQNNSIDISKIKIYSSTNNDQKFLGVLYGEYDNREQAVAEIAQLPEILRVNKPIPRTVKGIKKEINKSRLL